MELILLSKAERDILHNRRSITLGTLWGMARWAGVGSSSREGWADRLSLDHWHLNAKPRRRAGPGGAEWEQKHARRFLLWDDIMQTVL